MFLRLTYTAYGRYDIRSGALLYGVPTRNSAPLPSITQNRNYTRVGAHFFVPLNCEFEVYLPLYMKH